MPVIQDDDEASELFQGALTPEKQAALERQKERAKQRKDAAISKRTGTSIDCHCESKSQ